MTFALETRGLGIRFGGHVAVNAVSCAFAPGTLTAIVGPNGAGKTTYFNLISGQLRASAGLGLNLWSIWSSHRELIGRAEEVLETVALSAKRDVAASALPHGDQRKLEVGILMALEPDVFMFDEPTAGMSVDEVPVILDLIRALKARRDKTILLVEHKMDVVRELSDRIIVLHNGTLVADGEPAAVIASPIVQEAYLGIEVKK
jgi:branched-chain amino acid transport system ATP-binding protein